MSPAGLRTNNDCAGEAKKKKKKKLNYPCNSPSKLTGLRDVEALTFSRQSAHRWREVVSSTRRPPVAPPGIFLVLISVRGWVDPKVTVRVEELGQFEIPMTSFGIKPATFRLEVSVWTNCMLASTRWNVPEQTDRYLVSKTVSNGIHR
jgi:hypothetical protein